MRIDVPVAYKAYGKVQGSRMSAAAGFAEAVAYDIPDADDQDAPVVVSWRDEKPVHLISAEQLGYTPSQVDQRTYATYHGDETVRSYRGDYWRPLRTYEFLDGESDDVSAVGLDTFVRSFSRCQAKEIANWQNPNTRKNRVPDQHFSSVERTNREIALRDVGRYMARFSVIEGQVYVRCGQPIVTIDDRRYGRPAREDETRNVIVASTGKTRVWHAQTVRIITSERDERFTTRNLVYPIQAIKDVVGKAKRMNAQNDPEYKEIANAFNGARLPVYIDPEIANRGDEDECALNLRRFISIVESNPGELLPAADHYRLKLFYDLTSAFRMLPDHDGFDLLEAAGREYLASYAYYEEYQHKEQGSLRRAIEIAESREVTLDAAFPTPTAPGMR